MLTFTDKARERVLHFLSLQQSQGVSALRVAGNAAEHKLWLVKESDKQATDQIFQGDGFEVYLDPISAQSLEGATVDFIEEVMQNGFRIYYPSPTWEDSTAQRIQDVLDKQINPGIASHGGSVSLERLEGDTAVVSMGGGCQGCASAKVTLSQGVVQMIRAAVPEVKNVVDVTDHTAGENPYYTQEAESPIA